MTHLGAAGTDQGAPSRAEARAGRVDASVVIVSYNTRERTLTCIATLLAATHDARIEIVVVDNASTDGSAEAIATRFPDVTVIASELNLGFGVACNRAAAASTGRYVVLLNPDCVVLDGAVDRLVEHADSREPCGIVGGRTLNEDGTLNPSSCWGAPTLWSAFCQASGLSTFFARSRIFDPTSLGRWARDEEREVPVVSGCFQLVPRGLWNALDGFDEQFFMYGEDVDLSLRSTRHGPPPRIVPAAEIVHVGAASEPVKVDKLVRLLRAQRQVLRKHWRPLALRVGLAMQSFGVWIRAIGSRILKPTWLGARFPGARAWAGAWDRRREWR